MSSSEYAVQNICILCTVYTLHTANGRVRVRLEALYICCIKKGIEVYVLFSRRSSYIKTDSRFWRIQQELWGIVCVCVCVYTLVTHYTDCSQTECLKRPCWRMLDVIYPRRDWDGVFNQRRVCEQHCWLLETTRPSLHFHTFIHHIKCLTVALVLFNVSDQVRSPLFL